jgi:hypothetical protein
MADGRGRPPYEPTDKDRATVKTMAAFGVPEYDIAKVLGISDRTLRKYFWRELEVGHIEANSQVAASLFKVATGAGPQAVQAQMFWLRCRAGWRDKDPPAAEPPGKKEQRAAIAATAERGTDWESLLDPGSALQ